VGHADPGEQLARRRRRVLARIDRHARAVEDHAVVAGPVGLVLVGHHAELERRPDAAQHRPDELVDAGALAAGPQRLHPALVRPADVVRRLVAQAVDDGDVVLVRIQRGLERLVQHDVAALRPQLLGAPGVADHAVPAERQDQEPLRRRLTVTGQRAQERQRQRAAAGRRQGPPSRDLQPHRHTCPARTLLRCENAYVPVTETSSWRMLNCPPAANASHAAFSEQASVPASSRPSAYRDACTAKHCWTYSVVDSSCSSSYAPLNVPVTGDIGPFTISPWTLTGLPFSVSR